MRSVIFLGLCGACALTSCSSPGQTFTYKDAKASTALTAAPTGPNSVQAITLSFTLRNTWNQPLSVPWQIKQFVPPADPLTSGTIIASGTADIAAEGSSPLTHALSTLTPGSYSYALVLDPANSIAEDDETNNVSQTTVLVANQDITFGSPAPAFTLGSPAATSPITLQFSLQHTHTSATPAPTATAVSVPFTIQLNGAPITPISATPASPITSNPASAIPVSITVPATNSAGVFPYVIQLAPAVGDDSNTNNNSATIFVVIPSAG
jgi:CARDB